MAEERIRFIFETQDKASKQTAKVSNSMLDLAKKMGLVIGAGAALKKSFDFVKESTLLAARVETLGVVTATLGRNAGYTEVEIRKMERAIAAQGITTQKSRQALARMMQAQLDLTKSTELARMAQDAAVIAGTNSSEAFERLVNVIVTGNVRMARTMGIQADFNAGYQKMAKQLGKTTDELTATEKATSRTNTVLEQGEQIAGAYTEAMETVGKQLTSMPRYWEEFQLQFGEQFVDDMGLVIKVTGRLLKKWAARLELENRMNEAQELGIKLSGKWIKQQTEGMTQDERRIFIIEELTKQIDNYNIGQEAFTSPQMTARHHSLADAKERIINLDFELAEGKGYLDVATSMLTEGLTLENIALWEQVDALEQLKKAQDALAGGLQQLARGGAFVMGQQAGRRGDPYGGEVQELEEVYNRRVVVPTALQKGGSFTVPSGYPNDSYPMRVESGEHVKVTPAGQSPNADVVAAIEELKDEMYRINQELVAANS